MARIRCFLVEQSDHVQRKLRVDTWRPCDKPSYDGEKCSARVDYDTITAPYTPDADGIDRADDTGQAADEALKTDPSVPWPTLCETCGAALSLGAPNIWRYVDRWRMWRNTETGEEYARLHESSAGAMWRAPWLASHTTSQDDGAPLFVMTPGGEWGIDDQARNCTMPDDHGQQQHHCWVRHGVPPLVTVDKSGPTCGAGAGSIQCRDYHGFLRAGYLED